MTHTKNTRIYPLPQKGIDANHFASDLSDLSDDIELRFSVLKDLLDQLGRVRPGNRLASRHDYQDDRTRSVG